MERANPGARAAIRCTQYLVTRIARANAMKRACRTARTATNRADLHCAADKVTESERATHIS